MKIKIEEDSIDQWNSICDIIKIGSMHEPHASSGSVSIEAMDDDDDEITVSYSSQVFCMSSTISAKVYSKGCSVVESKMFGTFGVCTKRTLSINEKDSSIVFKSGRSSNKIGVIGRAPHLEVYNSEITEIDFSILSDMIKKVKGILKKDGLRRMADKMTIRSNENGGLLSFSTDGSRFSIVEAKMITSISRSGFALHMSSIPGLLEVLSKFGKSSAQMWGVTDSHMFIVTPDTTVRIPVLPPLNIDPYEMASMVEEASRCELLVDKKMLLSAIRKCESGHRLKTKEEKDQGLVGFIEGSSLVVGVAGSGFKMIEDVDVETVKLELSSLDKDQRFSVNLKYLRESLRFLDDGLVRLNWSGVDVLPKKGPPAMLVRPVIHSGCWSFIVMIRPMWETNEIKPERD